MYEIELIVWLGIIEGFLRIVFQNSLLLFSAYLNDSKLNYLIGDKIHKAIICLFITIWVLQFTVNFIVAFTEVKGFISGYSRDKKRNRKIYNKKVIMMQMKKLIPFFKLKETKWLIFVILSLFYLFELTMLIYAIRLIFF